MQIIQGIRDKGAAIVIVVIALSLIGFILMDAKQGSNRMFSSASANIGKVNGSVIEQDEFNKRVNFIEAQEEQQSRMKPSTARIAQIREQVWNQIVAERVFYDEASKLGIDFTPKELNTILFSNEQGNPFLQDREMVNPATGKIDTLKVQQTIKNIQKLTGEKAEALDAQITDPQKLTSISTKYFALLNASVYYPAWMEEKDIAENKSFANISYVSVPYSVINDSTIKVTDDEIEKYVQKHKDLYKQEEGRMISYIAFSQLPNAEDSSRTKGVVEGLKNEFARDSNVKSFLARNTSLQPMKDEYVWKSKMQGQYKDSIMLLQKGEVFGPYIEGNNYNLAKLADIKQQADSVKCRHILIKIADLKDGQIAQEIRADSTARRLIDSIATAVKGGADFNELVIKYSDDPGSKATKGEYSFNYDNRLVDSFYRTVFYEPVGTKKVVLGVDNNSYYGYHYIEVLDQFKFEPAYKVAYLTKEIIASETTINNASLGATKLSAEKDPKSFDAYLKKLNMVKVSNPTLLKENDAQVGPMQDARQLVRWVFGAKQGEVSDPYSIGDQFVVAIIDKIQKEGTQDVQSARPSVERIIKEEKKAEEIIKKIGSTMESASAAYNIQVATAGQDSSLTFTTQIINGIGNEPKLIGACFNKANLGKVAGPLAGKTGVYVFKVNSIANKAPNTAEEITQFRAQQTTALRSKATTNWFEGLRKKATIKDNRSKFY